MNDTAPGHSRWDLDYLMPEAPAQGRWGGGPLNHRQHAGNETLFWHPGDGSRVIGPRDGVRTLHLEDTDRTLEQLLATIRPEPNSAGKPHLLLGEIALAGVLGTITLGNEQIRFAGLHRLVIGGYSAYPTRGG